MADVYELNTIADLLKIPVKSLDACLRDLRYALELCHFAGGEDTSTMAFDSFAWTDDGRHDIDMSMNGEPFLKLNVTDEAALSHAAGQEAVAWQCRLIAIATGEVVDDWRECSKESFDVDGGRSRDGAYLRTEYRALYLTPAQPPASAGVGRDSALSRGVPEGMDRLRPRNWTREMDVAWHTNIPDTVKAFDALIAAAIAAQRKEGA